MKKILWLASITHFTLSLLASDTILLEEQAMNGDALSAFIVAGRYEEQGKSEQALFWYKKASELALGKTPKKNELTEGILKEKAAKIERTKEVYGSILDRYENDPKTYDSVQQMMTKIFDIAPYKSNYLLPITYDNVSHDDNRRHVDDGIGRAGPGGGDGPAVSGPGPAFGPTAGGVSEGVGPGCANANRPSRSLRAGSG